MTTVGQALAAFRAANGLHAEADRAETWTCRIGPVALRLPNFRWRRAAILRHDLHHVLTGYPCGLRGECQMAAWEHGAGPYPHPFATLFCLPLLAVGLLWSPRSIWRAYLRGRRGRSLYRSAVALDAPLAGLCGDTVGEAGRGAPSLADLVGFLVTASGSVAVLAAPAIAAGLAVSLL